MKARAFDMVATIWFFFPILWVASIYTFSITYQEEDEGTSKVNGSAPKQEKPAPAKAAPAAAKAPAKKAPVEVCCGGGYFSVYLALGQVVPHSFDGFQNLPISSMIDNRLSLLLYGVRAIDSLALVLQHARLSFAERL